MRNTEEVINGIRRYIESEVLPKLDTKSKILIGAALGMASNSMETAARTLQANELAKALGAVNDDGLFDVELIADSLKDSSARYGSLSLTVPFTGGVMSFGPEDIEMAKRYINGEA